MSLSESQFAAFKAITQQAQRLQRTQQTKEVQEVIEQIVAIARVQTNKIIDENRAALPPDNTPVSPMVRMQKSMSNGLSPRASNILWAVVIGLWLIVGYMGSQHFHEIFQQPAEATEAPGAAQAPSATPADAPTTAPAATENK